MIKLEVNVVPIDIIFNNINTKLISQYNFSIDGDLIIKNINLILYFSIM